MELLAFLAILMAIVKIALAIGILWLLYRLWRR